MADVPPYYKNLKPFKPGQSGNPSGRPKRTLTKDTYAALIEKYATMSQGELKSILDDPKTRMIDATVIAQLLAAASRGLAPDSILAYCIGKAAEVHQIETKQWQEDLQTISIDTLKKLSKGEE